VSKTYRALAIVAVVAPLVSIGSLLLSSYISLNHLTPPSPSTGERWIPAIALPFFWAPAISSLAAPVIATFAAAVAAESRRWGWLAAFIALGAFGVIGLIPFATAYPFLTAPYTIINPQGVIGLQPLITGYTPMVLLAVVALIFALLPHDEATLTRIKPGVLAIVIVVATLVSLISVAWSTHNEYAATGTSFNSFGIPILMPGEPSIGLPTLLVLDVSNLWNPVTSGLATPIIAALAIIMAAQARRWGWLVAFIVLTILCALGPGIVPELSLGRPVTLSPTTILTIAPTFFQIVPMLLLVVAALVFALWQPRAAPAAASAVLAPQAG
jgi:hypothetical protein